MELGRTENSEIIFIHTDDLEVTIKGGASPAGVERCLHVRFRIQTVRPGEGGGCG